MNADRAFAPLASVSVLAALLLMPPLYFNATVSFEFLATATLIVLVPGIGVIYTVSTAVAGGRSAGLYAAFGCTLGIVPHLLLAFAGLSGLMQLGATLFEVVRWAGVAYLVWMGIGLIRERGSILQAVDRADATAPEIPALRTIVRGVLLNLLNPKLTAFFFAFLPHFMDVGDAITSSASARQLSSLGALFMLLTLIGFVAYALAGVGVRLRVRRSPTLLTWLQRTFGALLLGFAARLAISER